MKSRRMSSEPKTITVRRSEVEACNIIETGVQLLAWAHAIKSGIQARNTIRLAFDGYDGDPRELWEITEVRNFVHALDEKFPYWFYFADLQSDFLKLIMFCLSRVESSRPGLTWVDPSDAKAFLLKHFHAMNMMMDDWKLDSTVNVQVTNEIMAYFERASTEK